jgi:DNA-binding transcriptional regulator of glucitol operon
MEQNKYLGIYIAPDRTTVVLAAKTGTRIEISDHFSIVPETPAAQTEPPQPQKFTFADTAAKIASQCAEKKLIFTNAAVAIDCRLYRQEKLHSEFQDIRQIGQTIKFDAEEALAVDAAQTAIAFELIGKQLSGSDVSTFAAPADMMTEIIKSLQANKIDPVTIEPDSICLRRAIDDAGNGSIIAAISQTKCFMICPAAAGLKPMVRSFITSPSQNKTALFTGQIMLTMTTLGAQDKVTGIKVFDTTENIDLNTLGQQTSMSAESLDISGRLSLPADSDLQDGRALELIIAAGAAAAFAPKTESVDFRSDFMPYQGKKELIERSVKIVSIGVSLIFLVIGIALQMHYFSVNKDRAKVETAFKKEYVIAMPGARFPASKEAVQKLSREINKLKDVKSGLLSASGEDSIEAKLVYLFEALNSVPNSINIDIDKIAVTTKVMTITGSTNLGGHLQLFGAFDKHPKLSRGPSSFEPKEGRDNFRVSIELKQGR